MTGKSDEKIRYALSFTSGSLLTREAVIAVPLYERTCDWEAVRKLIGKDNLFQTRTVSSGFRLAREVAQRLAVLSDDELELLADAGGMERGYLMWTAACRRYAFIGEFAEEVVRERFLLFTSTLTYNEFDGFVRGKALWHPELEDLKESTLKKLRAVVFQMLVEAGLLTDDGEIVPVIISGRLLDAFEARKPSDLRFFPATRGGTQ
ncbi:DUF1819 domain-containing protein [Rathayibacter sp. AY1G1]|nr:DUF1819 domain-containing protein [Rathayibacter sp. AY1G1]